MYTRFDACVGLEIPLARPDLTWFGIDSRLLLQGLPQRVVALEDAVKRLQDASQGTAAAGDRVTDGAAVLDPKPEVAAVVPAATAADLQGLARRVEDLEAAKQVCGVGRAWPGWRRAWGLQCVAGRGYFGATMAGGRLHSCGCTPWHWDDARAGRRAHVPKDLSREQLCCISLQRAVHLCMAGDPPNRGGCLHCRLPPSILRATAQALEDADTKLQQGLATKADRSDLDALMMNVSRSH